MSEFERLHRLDQIGAGENRVSVTAEPGERAALAARFGLAEIASLSADYAIRRDSSSVVARGHLSAQVTQHCSVTGDPLPVGVEEDFAIRFLPEPDTEAADEVELSEDACDTVFYTGGAIDLGEAAAETLLLSLDPFPRGPNAAAALKEAGVISEEEVTRASAFSTLKDLLGKKD
ncbi:YceD family protein [Sphingomonas soli]|uniref:YceD family protein n=1 Tax=Sphingomonas soli TaxID=266127 RepID=UPI0008335CEB|nr:DUF177 domain-containing protein [Sphingomonas soli]